MARVRKVSRRNYRGRSVERFDRAGQPILPSWAKSIRMMVDYWWNDEYEWCRGKVVEDPVPITADELLVTVHFVKTMGQRIDYHFTVDEKVRWRPPQ